MDVNMGQQTMLQAPANSRYVNNYEREARRNLFAQMGLNFEICIANLMVICVIILTVVIYFDTK